MPRTFNCVSVLGCLILAAGLIPSAARGADPATRPTVVASHVVAVTVYQGGALVTRELDVPQGTGQIELSVSPLPPSVVETSLYSEAAEGIRVLSTQYRTRAVEQDTRVEVRNKQDEIKKLTEDQQRLEQHHAAAQLNLAFIGKLETFTSATMSALQDKGMLNSVTTIDLAKYIMQQRNADADAVVDLQQQIAHNTEALQFANRQLNELTANSTRTEISASIVLEKTAAGPGKIRLNYLVTNANWNPQYRFRAPADNGQAADNASIQLEYLADVYQQTGEDWNDVAMTLSTAEPMLNAAPPDLLALDISVGGYGQPNAQAGASTQPTLGRDNYIAAKGLREQAQKQENGKSVVDAENSFNSAAALEQTQELLSHDEDREMKASYAGPNVSFHLQARHTALSRHDAQLIEVARIDKALAPTYVYKAIPVLTPHVFRQAKLVNQTDFVLLPGEATMYTGTDFVGRMSLGLVAIGQSFTIGLGVDPQVQVERQLVKKTNTIQGANQVHDFQYRVRISSFKSVPINVQVWDRIPRSEGEAVGVTMGDLKPALSTDVDYVRDDKPKNLLRWDIQVPPGASGEKAVAIEYEFKLEYDRKIAVGNFKPAVK